MGSRRSNVAVDTRSISVDAYGVWAVNCFIMVFFSRLFIAVYTVCEGGRVWVLGNGRWFRWYTCSLGLLSSSSFLSLVYSHVRVRYPWRGKLRPMSLKYLL